MPYIVCAEEMDGQWIAHVPDLPGSFSTHKDRETAIGGMPAAVEAYIAWAGGHGLHISGLSAPMIVSEVIRSWMYEDEYEVNAFFASDRPPVTVDELPEYELLLGAAHKDLLAETQNLTPEQLLTFSAMLLSADLDSITNVVAPGSPGSAGGASVVFLSDSVSGLWADLEDGRIDG